MRLIDADALKQKITMVTKQYKRNAIMERPAILLEDVDEAPTIDAEPIKYGKWTITECFDVKDMTCSYCGWLYEYYAGMEEEWNYCPHCGARMEGVEE